MRYNLIKERKKAHLTQLQVAKKINVTVRQYNRIEMGTTYSSVQVWMQLKKLFNQPIDYLLEQESIEKDLDSNPAKDSTNKE